MMQGGEQALRFSSPLPAGRSYRWRSMDAEPACFRIVVFVRAPARRAPTETCSRGLGRSQRCSYRLSPGGYVEVGRVSRGTTPAAYERRAGRSTRAPCRFSGSSRSASRFDRLSRRAAARHGSWSGLEQRHTLSPGGPRDWSLERSTWSAASVRPKCRRAEGLKCRRCCSSAARTRVGRGLVSSASRKVVLWHGTMSTRESSPRLGRQRGTTGGCVEDACPARFT